MAEFILKKLIDDAGRDDKFYTSSAHVQKGEGEKLDDLAMKELAKNNVPYTEKVCLPLAWADYDLYNYIILMDETEKWPFLKIIGGDPKEKVHLLGEFAGIRGDIVNPEETGRYEEAYQASLAGCTGLFEKLRSWVGKKRS